MVSILKIILSLFSIFIITFSYGQELIYKNFIDENITFPNELSNGIDNNTYTGSLLSINNINSIMNTSDETNGKLYRFISKIKVVKENSLIKSTEEEKYEVDSRYDSLQYRMNISLIGSYKFSREFKSYFLYIFIKDKLNFFSIKDLYLLNIKDGVLISICRVASDVYFEGDHNQTYSVRYKNDEFIYFFENLEKDIIIHEDMSYSENEKIKKRFYLESKTGFFKVIQ